MEYIYTLHEIYISYRNLFFTALKNYSEIWHEELNSEKGYVAQQPLHIFK